MTTKVIPTHKEPKKVNTAKPILFKTRKTSASTRKNKKNTSKKKYSTLAQKEVAKEMRKFKKGTATSGKTKTPVKSREQAIAIGLSKARAKGAKVPKKDNEK